MSKPYLYLLDRSLARTEHDAEVIPLARSTVQVLRDDLAELDAARAEIEQLRADAGRCARHCSGERAGRPHEHP